jgi:hypothetical protein
MNPSTLRRRSCDGVTDTEPIRCRSYMGPRAPLRRQASRTSPPPVPLRPGFSTPRVSVPVVSRDAERSGPGPDVHASRRRTPEGPGVRRRPIRGRPMIVTPLRTYRGPRSPHRRAGSGTKRPETGSCGVSGATGGTARSGRVPDIFGNGVLSVDLLMAHAGLWRRLPPLPLTFFTPQHRERPTWSGPDGSVRAPAGDSTSAKPPEAPRVHAAGADTTSPFTAPHPNPQ